MAKSAVTLTFVPPVRITVMSCFPSPSPTEKFAALNWMTGVSLSTIVNTAVFGVPSVAPPVGLVRTRFTVSLVSKSESLSNGTENDAAVTWPAPFVPACTPRPAYGNVVQIVPGVPSSSP